MMPWKAIASTLALTAIPAGAISMAGNLTYLAIGNDSAVVRVPPSYPVVEEFSHGDGTCRRLGRHR